MQRLPEYIRDKGAVFAQLDGVEWNNSFFFVTLNVTALYSSIPHHLALEEVRFHLSRYSSYLKELYIFLVKCIQFLLTHNFFAF